MSKFDLNTLNWSVNAKNQCAKNIRTAFWITTGLWDAWEWVKYCDSKTPEIWMVAVMWKDSQWLNEEWKKYGHVAVVTDIDVVGKKVRLFDGPNAFHFWTPMVNISGYITPEKMIQLWSTIKLINTNPTKPMINTIINNMTPNVNSGSTNSTNSGIGYYEEIFNRQYPNGWTIYKDVKSAADKFWDIAYFVAIWLERASVK